MVNTLTIIVIVTEKVIVIYKGSDKNRASNGQLTRDAATNKF